MTDRRLLVLILMLAGLVLLIAAEQVTIGRRVGRIEQRLETPSHGGTDIFRGAN